MVNLFVGKVLLFDYLVLLSALKLKPPRRNLDAFPSTCFFVAPRSKNPAHKDLQLCVRGCILTKFFQLVQNLVQLV